MIQREQRERILGWVDEAAAAGARRRKACALLGLSARTLERWRAPGARREDGRRTRVQAAPNRLSELERERVLAVANSAEFADLAPSQIVPILAERGEYIASESTFYRLLRAAGQVRHPERWSRGTRNWDPVETVYLNPDKEHGKESTHALKRVA
jgi:transposase